MTCSADCAQGARAAFQAFVGERKTLDQGLVTFGETD